MKPHRYCSLPFSHADVPKMLNVTKIAPAKTLTVQNLRYRVYYRKHVFFGRTQNGYLETSHERSATDHTTACLTH